MAIWLFRRKSRRKRARNDEEAQQQRLVNRSNTAPDEHIATPPRRNSSIRKNSKQRSEPSKLQRRARTYSFDAGRRESLNVRKNDHENAPPVPPLPAGLSTGAPGASSRANYGAGFGQDALGDGDMHRIPTLHASKSKRDGHHLGPRKSSKRRKNSHDREREAELKAMSNFVPNRRATEQWEAGKSTRRDTRRVRTGLGIGFGPSKEERDSTISLPHSVHSTLSTDSEHVSFKVSAFSALAARPTLRYSLEPRWSPPGTSGAPLRKPSQKRRFSEKEPITESTLKAHKRIHDLADELSASDLRELMERDQRRRDKKRQSDQEKTERRLQRRAEKQRQAVASGSAPAPNMERGVLGRENVGPAVEPPSAVVTSSRSRESTPGKRRSPVAADPFEDEDERESRGSSPIRSFHRTTSIPPEPHDEPAASEPEPEKLVPIASQGQSPERRGFLRVKKTRTGSSAVPTNAEGAPDSLRKGSESSSSRGPMSWTSIFRWGNKNRRESGGPSSFSNTSRDSMATMPQPTPPANFVPSRRMSSGVPRRTLSRFREDLPDFPLSPPESRLQSPSADVLPPAIIEQDSPPLEATADPMAAAEEHYDTPTSQNYSSDVDHMRETPARDVAVVSTEPQQSLAGKSMASIDSEASWLSGRIGSRRSSAIQQHRGSVTNSRQSQYQQRTPTGSDEVGERDIAEEEMAGIHDDEYLSQYARRPSAADWTNRRSVGDPQASSDEEELERGNDARWGSVGGGRMPTVVQGHSVKSREGLLNTFDRDDDDEIDPDSPISPISIGSKDAEAGVQRAKSVHLGRQHARHISAGSAKLLEISPRNSVDQRRSIT